MYYNKNDDNLQKGTATIKKTADSDPGWTLPGTPTPTRFRTGIRKSLLSFFARNLETLFA